MHKRTATRSTLNAFAGQLKKKLQIKKEANGISGTNTKNSVIIDQIKSIKNGKSESVKKIQDY
jgi:hypothetical protein